jgi:hypothetical protein
MPLSVGDKLGPYEILALIGKGGLGPVVWTETLLRAMIFFPNYDLAPDGKRLAAFVADNANDANGEKPLTHLTFLLNFTDELRRRAPVDK